MRQIEPKAPIEVTESRGAMRLATVVTPAACGCTCAARSGYVDVGERDRRRAALATLAGVLERRRRGARAGRAGRRAAGSRRRRGRVRPGGPLARPDPLPGRQLRRARARGRAAADDLARDVRARRRLRGAAVRRPRQAGADRALRLRGRARRRDRPGRPVHPRPRTRSRRSRATSCSTTAPPASGSGRPRSGRRARTSTGRCRSAPRSSRPTRSTSPTSRSRRRLNGEVMQSARTSQMIIDVPSAIEYFSSFTTLRPGDVIATGTPGGVGFARTPPVWLQAGRHDRGRRSSGSGRSQPGGRRGGRPTRAGRGARRSRATTLSDDLTRCGRTTRQGGSTWPSVQITARREWIHGRDGQSAIALVAAGAAWRSLG